MSWIQIFMIKYVVTPSDIWLIILFSSEKVKHSHLKW